MRSEKQEDFFSKIVDAGFFDSVRKLKFHLETLFKKTNFKNMIVLEIGSGNGMRSFYASFSGAEKVMCLEPEAEGSTSGIIDDYLELKKKLDVGKVFLDRSMFQNFKSEKNEFDIIIMYNSINHVDEKACIDLQVDEKSMDRIKDIFFKLNSILKKDGILFICDCSNMNFFNILRVGNPFLPSIEWHKHQSPGTWIRIAEDSGFSLLRLKWSSPLKFGRIGKILFSNKIISFFYTSHFCLTLKKLPAKKTGKRG